MMRICFIGDSFVNGTGDDECLGWAGRICAHARRGGLDLTYYNLGIRRDTSADIAGRWRREAALRLPDDVPCGLVFSFGVNDCTNACPTEDSLANAETILSEAAAWRPTLMVGPPPVADCVAADARVKALSLDLDHLCGTLSVPYLDLHSALADDDAWRNDALAGDGYHPSAGGYARMAALVTAWPAWRAWVYSPDATDPS